MSSEVTPGMGATLWPCPNSSASTLLRPGGRRAPCSSGRGPCAGWRHFPLSRAGAGGREQQDLGTNGAVGCGHGWSVLEAGKAGPMLGWLEASGTPCFGWAWGDLVRQAHLGPLGTEGRSRKPWGRPSAPAQPQPSRLSCLPELEPSWERGCRLLLALRWH